MVQWMTTDEEKNWPDFWPSISEKTILEDGDDWWEKDVEKNKMGKKVTYAPNSRGLDTLEKKTLLKFVARLMALEMEMWEN